MTFKVRYNALPGDMNNAIQFWGNADTGTFTGQCSAPRDDEGTGTQTCNGDGNGRIGEWDPSLYYEAFRMWQHLSNAGLIPGTYTGIHAAASYAHHVQGQNSPASRFPGGGWAMEYLPVPYGGDSEYFAQNYGNYLEFGGQTANTCYETPFLTPEQAWNIDRKSDDGQPGKGFVYVVGWNGCTTAASANQANTAQYNLTNKSVACSMIFRGAF